MKDLVRDSESAIKAVNELSVEVRDAAWLLHRAESAASSTIEGVYPSARRLARAEAQLRLFGETAKPQDQEALRNIFATDKATEIADRGTAVTVDDIRDIHATLMQGEAIAGEIRTTQNWIGSGSINPTPVDAAFVPPPPERVGALLRDLTECVNRLGDNPIVHAGIVHAQFETIHPFADGNGRTGRALIHLMLRRSGLTNNCTVPISSALAMRRNEYIQALNETHVQCAPHSDTRSQAMLQWLTALANASIQAAHHATLVVRHVTTLLANWQNALLRAGTRGDSAAMKLLLILPNNPVVTEASVTNLLGVNERTVRRTFRLLSELGVLVNRNAGKGRRVYEAHEILDAYVQLASVREGSPSLPPLNSSTYER